MVPKFAARLPFGIRNRRGDPLGAVEVNLDEQPWHCVTDSGFGLMWVRLFARQFARCDLGLLGTALRGSAPSTPLEPKALAL